MLRRSMNTNQLVVVAITSIFFTAPLVHAHDSLRKELFALSQYNDLSTSAAGHGLVLGNTQLSEDEAIVYIEAVLECHHKNVHTLVEWVHMMISKRDIL